MLGERWRGPHTAQSPRQQRTETVWQQVHRGHLECWTELTNWVCSAMIKHGEERQKMTGEGLREVIGMSKGQRGDKRLVIVRVS